MLAIVEVAVSAVILLFLFYFKVLTRPTIGEKEQGPFRVVYIKNVGLPVNTPKKVKEIQNYLQTRGIQTDTFLCMYLVDPRSSKGKAIPSIIGGVIDDDLDLEIDEPYKITTFAKHYAAFATNGNRLIGWNKNILYPRLFAYMNLMGYTNLSERFLEIYHMGEQHSFGKGFSSEVSCKIREMSYEELEEKQKQNLDSRSIIFGKNAAIDNN